MVVTPFFPSKESFVGSYIFDQVNEIKNQTNFNIQIIKVVSIFSSEKDYEFKGFNVHIFKIIDLCFSFLRNYLHLQSEINREQDENGNTSR